MGAEAGIDGAEVDQGVEGDGLSLFGPGEALLQVACLSGAAVGPLVSGVEVSLGRLEAAPELCCIFEGEDVEHMLGMDGGVGGAFRLEGGSEAVHGRVKITPVDCVFLNEVVEELVPRADAGDPIGRGVLRLGVRVMGRRGSGVLSMGVMGEGESGAQLVKEELALGVRGGGGDRGRASAR